MRCEMQTTLDGEFKIEIITETDAEWELLNRVWTLRGYPVANGQSDIPGRDGRCGFYIELGRMDCGQDETGQKLEKRI